MNGYPSSTASMASSATVAPPTNYQQYANTHQSMQHIYLQQQPQQVIYQQPSTNYVYQQQMQQPQQQSSANYNMYYSQN